MKTDYHRLKEKAETKAIMERASSLAFENLLFATLIYARVSALILTNC
jgi:hypothetical protein